MLHLLQNVTDADQGRSHISKIVSIFPSSSYKRPTTAVKYVEGRGMGEDVPLQPSRSMAGAVTYFLAFRVANHWAGASKALPAGSGAEQTIWGHFMCNFMRVLASFSAFSSCLETGDSYIPLLASSYIGLTFPFNFLGVSDTPNLNFWGVRTPTTPTVAASAMQM